MTNKIHAAFDQISASEELKTFTMQFLSAEREKRLKHAGRTYVSRPYLKILAAACAVCALLLGFGLYTMLTPVSYISIDVNPSLELALNRYDRVVSVSAYNDDGEIVLNGINVKGLLYTDAIDAIVDSRAMQPYLTDNSDLTFTVASNSGKKQDSMLTNIENCTGCKKHNATTYTADINSISEAHESGLSLGKYAAYLVLSQYDNTITISDCHNMSMCEIRQQISTHESSGNHNGHGNSGYGHGSGHGYGKQTMTTVSG